MNRRVLIRIGALALIASASDSTGEGPKDFLENATKATVYIKVDRTYRGQVVPAHGSGFFVDPRGFILTNWHVVAPQVEVKYEGRAAEVATAVGQIQVVVGSGTAGERTMPAKVVALDRTWDLALLWVQMLAPAVLPLAETSPELADDVWVLGYPFGALLASNKGNPEVSVTAGKVTAIRHNERREKAFLQFDAAAGPGSSGGPVMNKAGQVVGVVARGVLYGGRLPVGTNAAVPLELVREFISANQIRVKLDPSAVYVRSDPIKVTVMPLLFDLAGKTCEVEISGDDIATTRVSLLPKGEGFEGTVRIPDRIATAAKAKNYRLYVEVLGGEAGPALRQAFSLPVYEESLPKVGSQRDPAAMMQDRKELANQQEGGGMPVGMPSPSEEQGGKGQSGLAALAKSVKLRKSPDGSPVTITNLDLDSEVGGCYFWLGQERYASLPTNALKQEAMAFDLAECELSRIAAIVADQEAMLGPRPGPFEGQDFVTPRPCHWDYAGEKTVRRFKPLPIERWAAGLWQKSECVISRQSAQEILANNRALAAQAKKEVDEKRKRLFELGLCRCASEQRWYKSDARERCADCSTP